MKTKILSLLLALCLVATLLPTMVLAEESAVPEKYARIKIENNGTTFWYYDGVDANGENIEKYYTEGTAAIYATTTADGIVADGTADNWNLKFEWPVGGEPTLTLKGATLKGVKDRNPLSFTGNVACTIYVESDSTITAYGAGVYFSNVGLATLTGPGKLTITTTDGNCISFVGSVSNPQGCVGLIKDANLDLYPTGTSTGRSGINFYGGDLTIDNSKINITGSEEKSVGIWGYGLVTRDADGTITKIIGYWRASSGDNERNLTIQNGSVITAKAAIKVLGTNGDVVIKDSTVEGEAKAFFEKKPVLEGEYTAAGGTKADKLVAYNPSKVTSYKYFKIVPGTVELVPTEPTVTEPVTTPTEPVTTPTEPVVTTPTTPATTPATTPTEPEATQAPTKAPASSDVDQTDDSEGMSIVVIAVLVFVGILVLGLGGFLLVWFVIRPKMAKKNKK